ncbi:MAG: DUF2958 domain-containing protein [Methylocystis silviterrae]|uniref:DUF2958 domain-containing protein n=1 Tax=Methylocystis silviterrae TaxID=2743612 RepID=UPI003C752600
MPKGPLGLNIERDLFFTERFPLSVYARAARRAGRIVESDQSLRNELEANETIGSIESSKD